MQPRHGEMIDLAESLATENNLTEDERQLLESVGWGAYDGMYYDYKNDPVYKNSSDARKILLQDLCKQMKNY